MKKTHKKINTRSRTIKNQSQKAFQTQLEILMTLGMINDFLISESSLFLSN